MVKTKEKSDFSFLFMSKFKEKLESVKTSALGNQTLVFMPQVCH